MTCVTKNWYTVQSAKCTAFRVIMFLLLKQTTNASSVSMVLWCISSIKKPYTGHLQNVIFKVEIAIPKKHLANTKYLWLYYIFILYQIWHKSVMHMSLKMYCTTTISVPTHGRMHVCILWGNEYINFIQILELSIALRLLRICSS